MRSMYNEDVALLSTLVERDLRHWLQPEESSRAAASGQEGKSRASGD